MSEETKSTEKVLRFKNETVSPATRTGYALLLGAGILVFGLVFDAIGWIDTLVSILVVTFFHMVFNWSEPSVSDRKKPSKLSGTLATAQADMPWLEVFLSRGSRLQELAFGAGKGIVFVSAKGLGVFLYSIILRPINIMDQALPWFGIGILIIGCAAAWNWASFKGMLAPLAKIRKAKADESDAEPTPATATQKDS